jgi:predicted ferric reductase
MSSLAHQPNASDKRENVATENRVEEARLKSNHEKPNQGSTRSSFLNWLLAVFVFAVLAWLGIFNIVGAHTDIWRYQIYPTFESTYFEGRSGARVFTFLGVYYIIAGAVSLSCLGLGIHLPTPKPCLVRSYHLVLTGEYWTILEICMLALFVGMQIAVIITRAANKFYNDWVPTWHAAKLWYEVTKTLGKTSAITLLFLFIPVSKSCFWLDLFNLKFERAIKFHRWLAWFLVLTVVVHAASAVASLSAAGQFKACMWPSEICKNPGRAWGTYKSLETSRLITYGWLSFVLAIPLVVTSLSWFRRNKFEWFFYTHFLFIPCMVLLHLHFPDMIYYAAPGLAAYTLDKVLWFCSSRRPIRIVSLTTPVRGFVRMEIALDKEYTFEPGQWVQIKVPVVSMLQWHPMSVSSAPGHSTMTLDIKVLGDWTRGLESLATRFDPAQYSHTCIFMDQFHGSSHMKMQGYLNHSAVLMFAGGCGVTPMMSAIRMLVESGESLSKVRRAVLVWIVRKQSVVDLYRQELAYYQSLSKTKTGCELKVIVHATLSEEEVETDFVAVNVDSARATNSTATASRRRRQWSFQQSVMGYGHLLVLTVGAGGGYLLGVFLANYCALNKIWRYEYVSLLQLFLAVFFDALLVTIGMSFSLFRHHGASYLTNRKEVCHREVPPNTTSSRSLRAKRDKQDSSKRVYQQFSSVSLDDGHVRSIENIDHELSVELGCRPNIEKIVGEMKEWCKNNHCSSVGVSVCGPDQLIKHVITTCQEASTSSLPFVVNEETFEW